MCLLQQLLHFEHDINKVAIMLHCNKLAESNISMPIVNQIHTFRIFCIPNLTHPVKIDEFYITIRSSALNEYDLSNFKVTSSIKNGEPSYQSLGK